MTAAVKHNASVKQHTSAGHCPFLDRDDPRCAQHFGVNHLDYAFGHCVGDYQACPAYAGLRAESVMAASRDLRLEAQTLTELTVVVPRLRSALMTPRKVALTLKGRHVVRLTADERVDLDRPAAADEIVAGPAARGAA